MGCWFKIQWRDEKSFVDFRREKLHELPWLKKYGFAQLSEESAWTRKYWKWKVAKSRR
jgi:hypothetical protein